MLSFSAGCKNCKYQGLDRRGRKQICNILTNDFFCEMHTSNYYRKGIQFIITSIEKYDDGKMVSYYDRINKTYNYDIYTDKWINLHDRINTLLDPHAKHAIFY
jgi:hypothetical protein